MIIIRNSARCRKCGDEIESTYRHDYVRCSCGAIAVDGGQAYIRRTFTDIDDIIETSVLEEENSIKVQLLNAKDNPNELYPSDVEA